MKSVRWQLLVTLAATAVGAGLLYVKGLPPEKELAYAIQDGDTADVLRHLVWWNGDSGPRWTFGGETPLHMAVWTTQLEVASLLIARGADVNARGDSGVTPLHHLGRCDNGAAMARLLVEHGADVTARDEWGRTPLFCARGEAAQVLIDAGADVNARADGGTTPLHGVADAGDAETAQALIDAGADVNAGIQTGHTPLSEALIQIHADDESVETLWGPFLAKRTAVVKLLLARGARADFADDDGLTPLHWAASDGVADFVELLIRQGADVNARDKRGRTPLHATTENGDYDKCAIATVLMDHGAGVNVRCADGLSPLYHAAAYCEEALVKLLLSRGAEMDISAAVSLGRLDDVRRLLAARPELIRAKARYGGTLLHEAADKGHAEVARLLLAAGTDPNAAQDWDYRPLHWAALRGHADVVRALLAGGADHALRDEYGRTPLHVAEGYAATALLDGGADIHARTPDGQTPLHCLAYRRHVDAAQVLIDRGADIHLKDNGGWTPLHSAAERGCMELVEILVRRGAEPAARNDDGKTPADLSSSCNVTDFLEPLEQVP